MNVDAGNVTIAESAQKVSSSISPAVSPSMV
jgi:hypothetical protein